jgi:site-specific recombinase XerD
MSEETMEPPSWPGVESWATFLVEQGLSTGTRKKYLQALSGFFTWYEQEMGACLTKDHLTTLVLIAYREYLQHHKAAATVNLRVSALRVWCAWLTEQGYCVTNPATSLKLVSPHTPSEPTTLTQEQITALLRQAHSSYDSERNLAIVQMLLQTGIRVGECSKLKLNDFDFGEDRITVTIHHAQGKKQRVIPLPTQAWQSLIAYLAPRFSCPPTPRAIVAVWPAAHTEAAQTPVWLAQRGGALTDSAIGQMIADLVRGAGSLVPQETSSFTLRHTFARNYWRQFPDDLVGLANILGLTSLDTMVFVYQQLQKRAL